MKFKLSENLVVDTDEEPWKRTGLRIGLYADPGSGKSYTAAVLIEQWLDQGGAVVIFQPRAEWHTLKVGYPNVQVVGGPHLQSIPFTASHPKLYADAVVESGISLIFYTPDAPNVDKLVEFMSGFLDHLMKGLEKRKRPILVLIEEANRYVPLSTKNHPEGAAPWVLGRMIGRIVELQRDSRKLGVVPVLATQRPQELNFSVRQLVNLGLFGMFSIQDVGYLDKEVLAPMRKNIGIDVKASDLTSLHPREWIVVTRGSAEKRQVTVKRKTPHGAETPSLSPENIPEASQATRQATTELTSKLRELLEKEGAEESELEKAKRKVRDLEKDLEEANKKAEVKLAVKELLEGGSDENRDGDKRLKAEVVRLTDELDRESKENRGLRLRADELATTKDGLAREVDKLKADASKNARSLEAVKLLRDLIGTDSIDYDRLAAEVSKRIPQVAGSAPAPDIDSLVSLLLPKVLEKLPASSGTRYVPAPPRTVILKSFMDAEVTRLEDKLKTLSVEAKKAVTYLQAKGTNSTKRDLIIHVFGPSSTSGAGYTRVSKIIDEALATELIREDRAGRLYPNLKEKVEADLKPYEASKEDMDAVTERMMYLVAQGDAQAAPVDAS